MPTTLRQDLEKARNWAETTFRQHRKLIILAVSVYFVYWIAAHPIASLVGQWPVPIWFSYSLSALFVLLNFGFSTRRKLLLIWLCPLASLAQWSQYYAIRPFTPLLRDNLSSGWIMVLDDATAYLFGALALTLMLVLAKIPIKPRLKFIVGVIAFGNIQNFVSASGNILQINAGNYDDFGFYVGAQCFVATVLASLAFERVTREPLQSASE